MTNNTQPLELSRKDIKYLLSLLDKAQEAAEAVLKEKILTSKGRAASRREDRSFEKLVDYKK
jgi:hypothetical protein